MGFEDFTVLTTPKSDYALAIGGESNALERLYKEVQAQWPDIQPDEIEVARLEYIPSPNQLFLVYETQNGLFQVMAMSDEENSSFMASLRFAYCNPIIVYEPFCEFVTWIMSKWDMSCRIMRDLAPEQTGELLTIDNPAEVRRVLIPSMNYNRHLWQRDAGFEEAVLRSGDAIARFITPHLIPLKKVK